VPLGDPQLDRRDRRQSAETVSLSRIFLTTPAAAL
jgi:hypothetical protein